MTDLRDLDQFLRAEHGDAGCAASVRILGAYVELELAGETQPVFTGARRCIFKAAPPAGPITTGCSKRRAGSATSGPSSKAPQLSGKR